MSNWIKLINRFAISFVPLMILAATVFTQPTGFRDLDPVQRKATSGRIQGDVDDITRRINQGRPNADLVKKRLQLYKDLLDLNYDNSLWDTYADKYEEDLAGVIKIQKTAENCIRLGGFLVERFRRMPIANGAENIYPRNKYFDQGVSSLLEALNLTSTAADLQIVYTYLSIVYTERPQKLIAASRFQKSRLKFPIKSILNDLDDAVTYSRKSLEVGEKLPYASELKANLAGIYNKCGDIAVAVGEYQIGLKFFEKGQEYLGIGGPSCAYYGDWGNAYLKLNQFDKAIEIFNAITMTDDAGCGILWQNKGDAYAAKGEYTLALENYNKSLAIDPADSFKRKGWLHVKTAQLFLQKGDAEQALWELTDAAKKIYVTDCPEFYRVRSEAYRRLGKPELAKSDLQTAAKLNVSADCSP
ncbi:MAG: tetratricopeptide repeat protein [Acidobacteriota bacterium]